MGVNWSSLRERQSSAEEVLRLIDVRAPPVDVRAILNRLGVVVADVDWIDPSAANMQYEMLSGELRFDEGTAHIRLAKAEPEVRRRFTIAMFICHLLNDPPGRYFRAGGGAWHVPSSEEETAARFASELLIPRWLLHEVLDSEDPPLASLAKTFGVSRSAMESALRQDVNQRDPLRRLGLPENLGGDAARRLVEELVRQYAPERFAQFPTDVQAFAAQRRDEMEAIWRQAQLFRALPAVLVQFDRLQSIPAPEEVKSALEAARTLLTSRGWTQGCDARDGYGKAKVKWDAERAGRYSAVGAIKRAAGVNVGAADVALAVLAHAMEEPSARDVQSWNDKGGRRLDEVLKAFDAAIALIKLPATS